jgi:DNA-binding NarL/FixJ family response regulator
VISSRHWKRSTLARLSSLGQPARARSVGGLNWPERNEGLTDRESEILALITQGKSNADVAALTFLSPITVKPYIRTIYRKIGVASRTQAMLWGVRHGFTPDHHRIDHWRGGP